MNSSPCSVTRSILGQAWRWRGMSAQEPDGGFVPDDLTAQLLFARGVDRATLEEHRTPTIRGFMPDPSIFKDMERAADRVADAVEQGEAVTIFGDYDVDGATSAALLIRLLRQLGLQPGYYIPDRLMEGYGPSGEALVRLAGEGASVIITVDCGAQAFEALEMASGTSTHVIVVDHHKCSASLPAAYAIVNPNRLDEDEGAVHGHLAAVGVAFLLGAAIVRKLRVRGYFADRAEPRLMELLDLVALGTVADVASLKGLNRAYVSQGLKIMGARRNIGISALLDAARLNRAPLAADLGFALGPRINAGGRIGKSDLGVRLLTTEDPDEAREIAAELDRLNQDRRQIEADVTTAAEEMARSQDNRSVIVVAGEGWHPGVIGIVAGRLKEKMGRPAVVIALDGNGVGKGSGRSISGVDLGAAILAAKDSGMLQAGGGHAMAAGITIDAARIDAFADWIDARLAQDIARARDDRAMLVDAVVAPGGISAALVEAMDGAGPYGAGWPAPCIAAGPVRVIRADIVGQRHVRAVVAGANGKPIKTIAFGHVDSLLGQALLSCGPGRTLWIAGRAKIDEWTGRGAAELHLEDAAWAD